MHKPTEIEALISRSFIDKGIVVGVPIVWTSLSRDALEVIAQARAHPAIVVRDNEGLSSIVDYIEYGYVNVDLNAELYSLKIRLVSRMRLI
jgi:hypothetical protein